MRASVIVALLAIAAAPAHADPDHTCAVRIARAPAAIRAEIEHWLAGESSCNVALEVRVVATDGGYYLLARDIHGRVRERIVPDGASAGVLVASWASDDQLGADERLPNAQRPANIDGDDDDDDVTISDDDGSDDGSASSAAAPTPTLAPPGASPVIVARASPVPAPETASSLWLHVDVIDSVAGIAGSGLRADVDVWHRRGWSVGLAASIANGAAVIPSTFANELEMSPLLFRDIDAVAYVARTTNVWNWLYVRGAVGAGTRFTSASVPIVTQNGDTVTGVRATADASLLAGAELGHGWALELGLLLTATTPMTETLPSAITGYSQYDLHLDAAVGLQASAGLAHTL